MQKNDSVRQRELFKELTPMLFEEDEEKRKKLVLEWWGQLKSDDRDIVKDYFQGLVGSIANGYAAVKAVIGLVADKYLESAAKLVKRDMEIRIYVELFEQHDRQKREAKDET